MATVVLILVLFPQLPTVPAPSPDESWHVRLLDVTGDGRLDRLESGADGSLRVAVNLGARVFDPVVQALPRTPIADVLVDDLDGDRWPDLYLVSPRANVALHGDGAGHFHEVTEVLGLADRGDGQSAERVDLDGDGLLDLLLHNTSGDVVFWAEPGGRFERSRDTPDRVPPPGGAGTSSPVAGLARAAGATADGTDGGTGGPSGSPVGGLTGRASPVPAARVAHTGGTGLGGPVKLEVDPSADGFDGARGAGGTAPPPVLLPELESLLDALYVNDDEGEVDAADIADGSLTGADVSTSSGDVTFTDAVVTARQGVFASATAASRVARRRP